MPPGIPFEPAKGNREQQTQLKLYHVWEGFTTRARTFHWQIPRWIGANSECLRDAATARGTGSENVVTDLFAMNYVLVPSY